MLSNSLRKALAIFFSLALGACATNSLHELGFDAGDYDCVIVGPFGETASAAVDIRRGTVSEIEQERESVKRVALYYARTFEDLLEAEIRETDAFDTVSRELEASPCLLIDGTIDEFGLRPAVTLGYSSWKFEATVAFKDSASGELLGQIKADLKSTEIGLLFGERGDVTYDMHTAAIRVARSLAEAKWR